MQQASLTHSTSASGATHVRSTLLQQSLRAVRKRGYFQRWESYVDPVYRDVILSAIAPSCRRFVYVHVTVAPGATVMLALKGSVAS